MHEQDGDSEPAHHARRPMNAFLIFCKRHRSVVRDKYPNLENRSITKILGEWWANLEEDEKACYTDLAKQYKDAFFSANPDFKWYKLPAPPLRTLSSRPREAAEKLHETPNSAYHEVELERTNNNSTKVDFNRKSNVYVFENATKPLSMFTPGKLADEAQMGGLSSLLATKTETPTPNPYYSPHTYTYSSISAPKEDRSYPDRSISKAHSKENSIQELQNALSETTRIFEEDFDEEKGTLYYYEIPSDQITNQDVIDQIVDKRFSREDEYGYQRNSSDDERNSKSARTCKGKRYQEFVGGLIVNKRQKRDYNDKEDNYSTTYSWDTNYSRSDESIITDNSKEVLHEEIVESEAKADATDIAESDNNTNKTFKAADFDLDAKIKALPSLSLEKFQQKKRDNKRKKKTINLKPKGHETSQIINSVSYPLSLEDKREMAENWRDTMIGSQKRKPRKISITRLEINSLISSADYNASHKISPEIKIATEAPRTVVQTMDMCKTHHHNNIDLFALATLAEVASNTSRIEDVSTNINMTAKAND